MDNIFDGFEYYGAWFKKMSITFAGVCVDVDVRINGYDEEEIPAKGKSALISFLDDIDKYLSVILEGVFEYYQNRRKELGYDIENNSEYPDFKEHDQILKTLQLIAITVPDQDDYCNRAIFLVFNCDWDKENGVGVCLVGDTIEEVGFQDIAL